MKFEKGKVNILLDITYGSSAKGQICTAIADRFRPDILIGTSSTSSSHTVIENGEEFVFKVLPSASFLNRTRDDYSPIIFIAPSSGFEIEQLKKEIAYTGLDINHIIISARATVVTNRHKLEESYRMGHRLGSTHSGQSSAFCEKVVRDMNVKLAADYEELHEVATIVDYPDFSLRLSSMLKNGKTAFLEMPQGFPLSIDYSLDYPMNTFRNISPAQAMSDIGLNPQEYLGSIIGNMRVFPIRVSNRFLGDNIDDVVVKIKYGNELIEKPAMEIGLAYSDINAIVHQVIYENTPVQPYGFDFTVYDISNVIGTSGKFEDDMTEVSWKYLKEQYGVESEEFTTLTKMSRRIAIPKRYPYISSSLMKKSEITIKPDYISLTFVNYLYKDVEDIIDIDNVDNYFYEWLFDIKKELMKYGARLSIIQTGKDLKNVFFV